MVHAASLALIAKKALGDKVFATTTDKLCEVLKIDPAISGVDIVLLGPKDISGLTAMKLKAAVANKHDKICVILFYTNDKERDKIDTPYKENVRKVTPESIDAAIKTHYGDHALQSSDTEYQSNDDASTLQVVAKVEEPAVTQEPEPEPEPTVVEELPELPKVHDPIPEVKGMHEAPDEAIDKFKDFRDWEIFQKSINKDSVYRQLLNENFEFQGFVQTLDVLDKQIASIYRDSSLSYEQKFQRITDVGAKKAAFEALKNSAVADKMLNMIARITDSAKRLVDERLEYIQKSLHAVVISREEMLNTDSAVIEKLIQDRCNIVADLHNTIYAISSVFIAMDSMVNAQITTLDEGIPSSNVFVNQMFKPLKEMILPSNTIAIANKLMSGLEEKRVVMSQLKDKVESAITQVFSIIDIDEQIILQQQKWIEMLKAQRVEDIVVRDTVLKNMLHVFVGDKDSGATATTLMWAYIQSRRANTLLIDITGDNVFSKSYNQRTNSLAELKTMTNVGFAVLEGLVNNETDAKELVHDLKQKLYYYPCIVIFGRPEQGEVINTFAEEALTINFVTCCTGDDLQVITDTYKRVTYANIARKMIAIDPPSNPINLLAQYGIDPTIVKVIDIPHSKEMRECSLFKESPCNREGLVTLYEEVFR